LPGGSYKEVYKRGLSGTAKKPTTKTIQPILKKHWIQGAVLLTVPPGLKRSGLRRSRSKDWRKKKKKEKRKGEEKDT